MLLSEEERVKNKERVLLVGIIKEPSQRWEKKESMEELQSLTETAGGDVIEKIIQIKREPDPATLIGSGKVMEVKKVCEQLKIDLIIFDDLLSPVQRRNLQERIGRRVIDRRALILDIFAIHARTSEAKYQVELAQLEYNLSQLTGAGEELSRLGGGIGTRGPGEKKLEVDRRRIKKRISILKKKLKEIEKNRKIQRKNREGIFRISLAGYTNAGKSTLINRLCGANIYVSSIMFATLDPFTREFYIKNGIKVLITDTVGFIRNLPLELVASFRATLSEIIEADLVLHVVDITRDDVEDTIESVDQILKDIGTDMEKVLYVFNKIDRVVAPEVIERMKRKYKNSVFISARTGEGIDSLKESIWHETEKKLKCVEVKIPDGKEYLLHLYRTKFFYEKREDGLYIIKGYPSVVSSFLRKIEITT